MAKIAILYECLGRSKGGIEAWIYHASEELILQGHQVTLVKTSSDTPKDSAPEGVEILTLRSYEKVPIINMFLDLIYRLKKFKSFLFEYDMVWVRSYMMAYTASIVLGKEKVIYINAAPFSLYGQISFKDKLRKANSLYSCLKAIQIEILLKAAYLLEKKAILNCKNVFLSKARMVETFSFFKIDHSKIKKYIIPAGVNTNRFFPNSVNIKNETFRIISVCRLEKDKNIQCVLKAVKRFKEDGGQIEYTIVGIGSYENYLKGLAKELDIINSVSFVGKQSNVEDWYRLNNVFVLPSLYEGFGSVYIEAMASGLPCIAISSQKGLFSVAADEIIDHNVNGFLMLDDDSEELYYYLRKFTDNPEIISNMSINARGKVETEYSWSKTVERLLAIKYNK